MHLPKNIGRYEILEWVGRGGMGVLYRATDPVLERDVAIKVMAADFSDDEVGRSRFFREARAVARLQHRNIVTLFDFGEDSGAPYIVMEFLRGQTLAQRMRSGAPLTVNQTLDVVAQLGTGLHFAHQHGITHRDVKPANIWLLDDGGVKLLDFGIAKFGESTLTTAGDVVGSIAYMSPEQLRGDPTDTRADIFSAGIVLYELLAGKRPFNGETPTAIMMQIINGEPPPLEETTSLPDGLSDIVMRALEKAPDRRYQHGAELATDLLALRATFERAGAATRPLQGLAETAAVMIPPSAASTPRPASSPGSGARNTGSRPPSPPPVAQPPSSPSSPSSPSAPRVTMTPSASRRPATFVSNVPPVPPSLVDTHEEGEEAEEAEVASPADLIRRDMHSAAAAAEAHHHHEIDLDLVTDAGRVEPPSASRASGTASRSGRITSFPTASSAGKGWRPAGAVAGLALLGYLGFVVFRAASPAASSSAETIAKQTKPGVASPGVPSPPSSRGDAASGQPPETVQPQEPVTPKPPAVEQQPERSSARPGQGQGQGKPTAHDTSARPHSTHPDAPAPPATPPISQAGFWVAITGPYAFEVQTEDGQVSRSSTRHELQVSGKQTLRLRAPQYALDRRIPIDGPPGGTVRVSAPALGRLTIRTPFETCEALVNGRSLGFPPIVDQQLAAGTYRIVLSCPDGEKHTETVQIAAGQTETALIR